MVFKLQHTRHDYCFSFTIIFCSHQKPQNRRTIESSIHISFIIGRTTTVTLSYLGLQIELIFVIRFLLDLEALVSLKQKTSQIFSTQPISYFIQFIPDFKLLNKLLLNPYVIQIDPRKRSISNRSCRKLYTLTCLVYGRIPMPYTVKVPHGRRF